MQKTKTENYLDDVRYYMKLHEAERELQKCVEALRQQHIHGHQSMLIRPLTKVAKED